MTREEYNEILDNDQIQSNTAKKEVEKHVDKPEKEHKIINSRFFIKRPTKKSSLKTSKNIVNIFIIVTITCLIFLLIFILLGAIQGPRQDTPPQYPPGAPQQIR